MVFCRVMARTSPYRLFQWMILCVVGVLIVFFHGAIEEMITRWYHFFSEREKIRTLIETLGLAGPAVFILIQVVQVVLAPIPGEASGFIGGYLFGTFMGFACSTIGLTAGSWINFSLGRFIGKRYVRKLIPKEKFEKFDSILKRQGVIVIFILFVFPGFPKDFLCLFLGVSTLSMKLFLILSTVGRIPGTLMLSMQGAFLYRQNYGLLAVMLALSGVFALVGYCYREKFYRWAERFNNR